MKGKTIPVNVVKVIDGDSVQLKRSGLLGFFSTKSFEARLYGIDAPEYRQPLGPESRTELERQLRGGQLMAEIVDVDRYGRNVTLLYHKARGRKESVNLAMVKSGYAHWYDRYGGRELGFDKAQRHAQANSLGVWRNKNTQKPWDYRKEQRGQGPSFKTLKWAIILGLLAVAAILVAKAAGIF